MSEVFEDHTNNEKLAACSRPAEPNGHTEFEGPIEHDDPFCSEDPDEFETLVESEDPHDFEDPDEFETLVESEDPYDFEDHDAIEQSATLGASVRFKGFANVIRAYNTPVDDPGGSRTLNH